jgi:MtN3 and saliva related transmembrane protein
MHWGEAVGLFAALCSSLASVPQLIAAYRDKMTRDLHIITMLIRGIGCLGWIIYSVLKGDHILVVSSSVAFLVESLLIIAKGINECNYNSNETI